MQNLSDKTNLETKSPDDDFRTAAGHKGPVFIEPHRPQLKSGTREVYCRKAVIVQKFGRSVAELTFIDPLNEDKVLSYLRVSTGCGTKFFAAWVIANDGKRPRNRQRMEIGIFEGKFFEVTIGKTKQTYDRKKLKSGEGYSVVKTITRRTK